MAKSKRSLKQTQETGASPQITRRAVTPDSPPQANMLNQEKQTVDIRILSWFGNNNWLLALMNLGAAIAMFVLGGTALITGGFGLFLPLGFGLLGLRFVVVFLEVALQLQLGGTGKILKTGLPLIALIFLVIGLSLQI
ncbi:hypothetical protein [Candidatus Chlorohelix sp.]|uniref:hypothetical protein n=1 Tax=Candidatus Chlorohelix sp. TaxID=3139201 RepID=UPI00302389CC